MPDLATLVRQHAERYDAGDYAEAADHAILLAAADILARDLDEHGSPATVAELDRRIRALG